MTIPLSRLQIGDHFTVSGQSYELVRINQCRALVRALQSKHVVIREGVEFDRPGELVNISPESIVERIER